MLNQFDKIAKIRKDTLKKLLSYGSLSFPILPITETIAYKAGKRKGMSEISKKLKEGSGHVTATGISSPVTENQT